MSDDEQPRRLKLNLKIRRFSPEIEREENHSPEIAYTPENDKEKGITRKRITLWLRETDRERKNDRGWNDLFFGSPHL